MVKVHQIAAKVIVLRLNHETIDGKVIVSALDEVELCTCNVRVCAGGRRVAVVTEGIDFATKIGEPNHDFVGLGAPAAVTEEGIICYVGADVIARIATKFASASWALIDKADDFTSTRNWWEGS